MTWSSDRPTVSGDAEADARRTDGSTCPARDVHVRARGIRCVVASISIATALAGAALDAAADDGPARVVVKYSDLTACASCPPGQSRANATQSARETSLRELEARLDVRGARALFGRGAPQSRSASATDRMGAARGRFPQRSARAPAGVVAPDLSRIHVVELPPGSDLERAVAEYTANPFVEWAHADRQVHVGLTPNDPLFAQQWGPTRIDAPIVWNTASGAGVVIAVVDTGVDRLHADLAANMWSNAGEVGGNGLDDDGNGFVDDLVGWDFVADDAVPEDRHGHGTHVAGVAAATANNSIGVAGIGFGARVMALKGLGDGGSGSVSDLAAAIVYAAENGADVINNSWGGFGIAQVLVDAVETARALGVVVVAAAGNQSSSANNREPAGIPGVIAVGASSQTDTIAGFSNHGDVLSVAAPGVDVLSLRAAGATGLGSSGIVQQSYQLLSGTSMAAPHVAGLAAVVLSAMPALQAEQVRWQLELNADQPGHPGYEGQAWNPYFGWGRIDAGRALDPVPVTTRLRPPPSSFHGIAGTITPNIASLSFSFTTLDPVAWTLASPSWLPGLPAGGSGDDTVTFDFDASALTPGTVSGEVEVSAPAAVDGGGSTVITAHAHRDERVGSVAVLAADTYRLNGRPVIGTDGVGSVIVWDDGSGPSLALARVDGGGAVGQTTTIAAGFPPQWQPAIAFDGRNYLVVWFEAIELPNGWLSSIKGMRVAADGTPVDATPFTIAERKSGLFDVLRDPELAFDGQAYTVIWEDLRGRLGETRVQARRVGADGTLRGRSVKLYPDKSGREPRHVEPSIGCAAGRCLVAWAEFDGDTAPPDGHYVDKAYGVMLEGGVPLTSVAPRLMDDAQVVLGIASDGNDFLLSAFTRAYCPTAGKLQDIAVATRVTRSGVSLDPNPIRLDRTTPDCPQTLPFDALFDGTDYVIPFRVLAAKPPDLEGGYYLFGARLALDGTVLDDEVEGLLLHEEPRIYHHSAVATRLETLVVWNERKPTFRDAVKLRRVLRRAATPGYPAAVIGAIGSLAVAEGQELLREIKPPPGFNPATTTLSATGLPPGATFDAPTGAFRWRPDGTEAGAYSGLTFTATSGPQSAFQTVSISVSEAIRSLSGFVRLANGSAVTDAGVQIGGLPGEKPVAFTDRDGRYRLTGLPPRTYSAKLDRASRKRYRVLSVSPRVALGAGDVVVPDLIVEPKS